MHSTAASAGSRRVVKQGWVHKRSGNALLTVWRLKWMVLVDQPALQLLVYDKREHAAQHLPPKAALSPLELVSRVLALSPSKRRPFLSAASSVGDVAAVFTLATPSKEVCVLLLRLCLWWLTYAQYTLATSTEKERDEWIAVLKHYASDSVHSQVFRPLYPPVQTIAESIDTANHPSHSNDDHNNAHAKPSSFAANELATQFRPLLFYDFEVLSSTDLEELSSNLARNQEFKLSQRPGTTLHSASDPWNEQYQALIAESANGDLLLQKDIKLCQLIGAFRGLAQTYAQKIIDEYHITRPGQGTTILAQRQSQQVGTWLYSNILFYLAAEYEQDEGDESKESTSAAIDVSVRKAAHELLGINQLNAIDIDLGVVNGARCDLHTALMCLINYKGFRIVAYAILPLEPSKTLVFDLTAAITADTTNSIIVDPTAVEKLNETGVRLGLKEHRVKTNRRDAITLRTSATVEVHYHQQCDHYYVLNLCDLFPLDHAKAEKTKLPDPLKRLRPEYVKIYRHPLSSDAYTTHQVSEECEHNNHEVMYASKYLRENHIPEFVRKLDQLDILPIDSKGFSGELHRHGINMRYLGLIAKHTKLPYIKELCIVEMIARSFKHVFYDHIRGAILNFHKIQASKIDNEMKNLAVSMFCEALGSGEITRRCWDERIKLVMQKKFSFGLLFDTFLSIHRPALFLAMQIHCGVLFDDTINYNFDQPNAIKMIHFIAFTIKVKHVEGLHSGKTLPHLFKNEEEVFIYELARTLRLLGPQARLDKNDVIATKFSSLARFCNLQQRYKEAKKYSIIAANLSNHNQASHALILLTLLETNFMLSHMSSSQSSKDHRIVPLADSDETLYRIDVLYADNSKHNTNSKLTNFSTVPKKVGSGSPSRLDTTTRDNVGALECVELYERALNCLTFHWGADHPLAISIHDKMSMLFCRVGQLDKGVDYHHRALALSYRILGKHHVVTARHLLKSGHLLLGLGQIKEALRPLNEALQILQSGSEEQHAMLMAETQFCIADTLQQNGDIEAALTHAQAARRIREKQCGPHHPTTATSYLQVAKLLLADFDDEQEQNIITPQIRTNVQSAIACYEKVFRFHKSRKVVPEHSLTAGITNAGINESFSSYVSASTTATNDTSVSSTSILTASSTASIPLVHSYPYTPISYSPPVSTLGAANATETTIHTATIAPPVSAEAKNSILLSLARKIMSLKLKLLPSHLTTHVRNARAQLRQPGLRLPSEFSEESVQEVILRLVHLTPIVCLEDTLNRVEDSDPEASNELTILVSLIESKSNPIG